MIDGLEKSVNSLIDGIKTKIYGKTFKCPVCHLELSYHDLDENGLLVCPLCGIVIEVTDVFGHTLAVVHDVEIKRYQPKARLHPVATHLPIGLFPFSLLFSMVLLIASFVVPLLGQHCFMGVILSYLPVISNLSEFLLLVSLIFSVPAFLTGLYDWYYRYEKRRYRTIDVKIVFSIIFLVLGLFAFLLHHGGLVFSLESGVIEPYFINVFFASVYFLLMLINMLLLTTLGHLGGLLVFGK
ncbi:MAG: hypothetical protein OHK0040_05580 [bacterium]